MGEDGTPEETSGETSGAEPTPPEGPPDESSEGGTAAQEPVPPTRAADETQEIPVVADAPESAGEVGQALELPLEPPVSEPTPDEPSVAAEPTTDAEPTSEATPTDVEAAPAESETASPVIEPVQPAEPATDEVEPVADDPGAPVTETVAVAAVSGPAHAAPGGRSAWRTVLAVVASLAILAGVGLAGYAYGRSSAPGPDIVVQGEPVTEQSAGTEAMPAGVMPSTVAPILSVRNEAIGAPTAVLTPAAGLDDTPGTAMGYRLVNSGISGGQIASVLATAFGVKGSTIQQGGTWSVGKEDGAKVVVTDDALFSWEFKDPDKLANPSVGQQLEPADAIDLANTMLSSIGVDTSAVDWQVDRYFDRTAVTAWQVIADQRTQLRWLVAFDPEGSVVQAAGFSAGLEPVASYPVVGGATAVNRSNTPPWWTLGATLVTPASEGATAPSPPAPASASAAASASTSGGSPATDASPSAAGPSASALSSDPVFGSESATPDTVVPSTPASPAAASPDTATATQPGLVVRVDDVVVTDARLGLAQFWQPDGSVLMLPSYVLTGLDGSTWSLIAVADEFVEFVPSTDPLGGDSTS